MKIAYRLLSLAVNTDALVNKLIVKSSFSCPLSHCAVHKLMYDMIADGTK